jgi:hypothetical protein
MKKSFRETITNATGSRVLPVGFAAWLAALAILWPGAQGLQAQTASDNFNDRTDNGAQGTWSHYDLGFWTSYLSGGAVSYGTAHYSFPTNTAGPAGNYGYRIQGDPTGSDPMGIGRARASSFRTDVQYGGAPYSVRFLAGVDLIAWNVATLVQDVGMLFMVQPATIAPGSTFGYALTYETDNGTFYLSAVANESPRTIGEQVFRLDPARQYRLVISSHDGFTFLGTVYDTAQTNTPCASAITQDATYQGAPGYCGLLGFQEQYPSDKGVDVTFDNYFSTAPAAGAMPATVTDLLPAPAGKATAPYPTVTVGILNRDTSVDTSSILLWMDGAAVPAGSLGIDPQVYKADNPNSNGKSFSGATITYSNGVLYPWGSKHTNVVAFKDDSNAWQTNTWSWTSGYALLPASNSLPLGSLTMRGFDARLAHSTAANMGSGLKNSVESALAVLAVPPQYAVDYAATGIVQIVSWDTAPPGRYGAVTNFPGLCMANTSYAASFAVETLAYLQLTAGAHRFYVDSDDSVGIYSGTSPTDTSIVLFQHDGSVHESFDFVVEAAGLYPITIIYQEGGPPASLVLSSESLSDGTRTLLNDADGVPAFYPLVCKSSSSVKGVFTADATANSLNSVTTANVLCDGTGDPLNQAVMGGTITVPVGGSAKFYRLAAPRPSKFTSVKKSGSNLVIVYQAE